MRSSKSSRAASGVFTLLTLLASGCYEETEWGVEPDSSWSGARPASGAPRITEVTLPTWPPLGPGGTITVTVESAGSGGQLRAGFVQEVSRAWSSSFFFGTVTLRAEELGEGYGRLDLEATAASGRGRSARAVEDLLIDLTPPTVSLERSIVSPSAGALDNEVALWISDAFVLGSVEMTFQGKTFRHELPKAYPATLGKGWDVSRVTFPTDDLEDGKGTAVVVVRDAAGNTTTETFTLRIDATPPVVAITSPAPATTVAGPFDVVLSGKDAGSAEPVEIDIYLGGARTATLLGPNPRLTVNPSSLSKGPLEIRAVARDEAGNESVASVVTVNVE